MARTSVEADKRLRACIDTFVQELTSLVREATFEQLSAALDLDPRKKASRRSSSTASLPSSAGDLSHGGRGRGPKRSSQQVEAQCEQIVAYLNRSPGQGAEAIANALGTSSKGINLALKKLLATRQISREGRKRATKYYPAAS